DAFRFLCHHPARAHGTRRPRCVMEERSPLPGERINEKTYPTPYSSLFLPNGGLGVYVVSPTSVRNSGSAILPDPFYRLLHCFPNSMSNTQQPRTCFVCNRQCCSISSSWQPASSSTSPRVGRSSKRPWA